MHGQRPIPYSGGELAHRFRAEKRASLEKTLIVSRVQGAFK
uniref:Uncharacterized protein n=1 Tax=Anguilla anguilla TaxID=7936 RepID=A0A0E9TNB6_ANGAN